jgi:hypothetical protein
VRTAGNSGQRQLPPGTRPGIYPPRFAPRVFPVCTRRSSCACWQTSCVRFVPNERVGSQCVLTALVDLYAGPHLALPEEAGTLFELEIAGSLIGLEGFFLFFQYYSPLTSSVTQLQVLICGCFVLVADVISRFTSSARSHGYVYSYDSLRLYHDYDLLRFYIFIS